MRPISLLAISCVGAALCVLGQRAGDTGQITPTSYELYSWHQSNGGWAFCALPSPSGVYVTAEQVFNRKCLLRGVKELKREISRLPEGATIFWLDRILGTDQSANYIKELSYPPVEAIQDIRRYAETRKINIELLPDEREQR